MTSARSLPRLVAMPSGTAHARTSVAVAIGTCLRGSERGVQPVNWDTRMERAQIPDVLTVRRHDGDARSAAHAEPAVRRLVGEGALVDRGVGHALAVGVVAPDAVGVPDGAHET